MRTTFFCAALMTFTSSIAITFDSAHAVVVDVGFEDDPKCCDTLFVPSTVDELGRGTLLAPSTVDYPFPPDETIRVAATETYEVACEEKDNPDTPNALVYITNTTVPKRSFKELWFVGNPNTYLSNHDGVVFQQGYEDHGSGLAFRIDYEGKNRPLIDESKDDDGIFQPGETWAFIIQDFSTGTGPFADEISSIGVAGGSLAGGAAVIHHSSGSIIAVPMIPEPNVAMLLGSALMAFIGKSRKIRR